MIDISEDTDKLIKEINDNLKEKCPGLQVNIVKKIVDFKLCLFLNDKCVSFIMIDDDDNKFNITSVTNDKYRGNGYNKFLTAVTIYLARTMTNELNVIYSATTNPARMHILEQYENTKNIVVKKEKKSEDYEDDDDDDDKHNDDDDDDDKLNKVSVKEYEYFVEISTENENKAKSIIDDWINNKKCIKVKTGGKKTRRNKQKRKSKKRKTKRRK